ncbi:kazrin isoform X5 [Diabrotica virgifera virgifera]|uniref:Kazrin isoform X7 n=1 Tax=Diabrotica virgifera virgifera TaxID=50390 RepID=A0A6P7FLQ0_DIAVI|nr:kazrin isoform X5 [Diabrotica virgifera virgifera]
MALLMRRLFVDAQAKLRRMVEEHSTDLTSRIESDYPNSSPAAIPSPACTAHEAKVVETLPVASISPLDVNFLKPTLGEDKVIDCDVDLKYSNDNKKNNKSNRPNYIETKRSKSLSVEGPEDISKKDIKKTRSNPLKSEDSSADNEKIIDDTKEVEMTVEENIATVLKGSRSSLETRSDSPKPGCSSQPDIADSSSPRSPRSSDGNRDDLSALLPSPSNYPKSSATIRRLRQENERLQAEVTRLKRLVVSGATSALAERKNLSEKADPNSATHALELELELAREALSTLKADKRRLKAEKFDLLNQMKQLYLTLEDKEKELRDFIRSYGQARRQLASSGCLSDQESLASLPRHNINGGALTPGSGGLLSGHHGLGQLPGDRGSCSADSGVRVSSDRESGATSVAGNLSDSTTDGTPTITLGEGHKDMDSVSLISSVPPPHMYQSSTKDCSPTLSPLNANNFSRSVEQLSSPMEPEPITVGRRNKQSVRPSSGRGGTWGSISRVFARSRHRNKSNSLQETSESYDPYRSWSPLTEEGYAEKLRLLREANSIPMERWRASTVLAWLEIALGMSQYGARCAENIKSGKIGPLHGQVLLELSDLELECGLGITHPMHRKKIRLAIEEHRNPALVRYPCIAQLGHTWVCSEWLPDLGLSQYCENFATNMVDARMLEHLSKKELEKYLGVTRKFHQASIVHGIHLLRIMKYDRQALAVRRHQCETMDADPLVWTNQRFIRWARSIDLAEYADNLKDSGVHGGLVVLEPSFNGDTMATALGIPASKNIIRRHLTAELDALILPARSTLEHYVRVRAKSRVLGGSLGRTFSRSCGGLAGTSTANRDSFGGKEQHKSSSIRIYNGRRPEF